MKHPKPHWHEYIVKGDYRFTPREYEILYYLVNDWTTEQISDKLSIKKSTVIRYLQIIKRKTYTGSVTQLVVKAVKLDWVDVELPDVHLSDESIRMVGRLAQDASTLAISHEMYLARITVQQRIRKLFVNYNIRSRVGLVVRYTKYDWAGRFGSSGH